MNIWPRLDQRSEEWARVRAGRPTASNFSRIFTPGGKDSTQWDGYCLDLCADSIRPDEIKWEGNRHTDRGNELEPEAREAVAAALGLVAVEVGFITLDDGVVGCSPDALLADPAAPGRYLAGLEIKCPLPAKHAAAIMAGGMPKEHRPQVHGGMAVTGLDRWYFASYCPGMALHVVEVRRDDYTDKLADALDRFVIHYAARRAEWMPRLLPSAKNAGTDAIEKTL
jgi:hypothetical protein